MAAYVISSGALTFYDAQTLPSVVAALDTYVISNASTLVVRTDTYACANHSLAGGSLDTVSYSGTGGELRFDPTYVRVIAFTAGSGTSPAYGAAISQGGVSGVFLGVWANWQSEPLAAAAAMVVTGFIKIGGVTGGAFVAGALTGITATCSGADVQGWIEARGPDIATITVPRIGKVTSIEAWYELGLTNGVRGQTLACPTTATAAGTFPGVWVETAVGSGVYEIYTGVGAQVALATTATDVRAKFIWSTITGVRFGNDGTNAVGFLPPTGCRVRIPATILTNCTRTVSGSGPRVIPNATIATRQRFVTTGAGFFDLRGCVIQWHVNFSQAFYVKYKSCAINDAMILSEIASPLDVDDCLVSPTQAQSVSALQITSCFAGGAVARSNFNRFSLAVAGNYVSTLSYVTGVTFTGNMHRSLTLRANVSTAALISTQAVRCTHTNEVLVGGRAQLATVLQCTFNNATYYDHTITTPSAAVNTHAALDFSAGCSGNVVSGVLQPIPSVGAYNGLVNLNACYNTLIRNIGTDSVTPLVLSATVTGLGVSSSGNNDGITIKRMFLSNTRTGPYQFLNSDTNILIENCAGDYADVVDMAGLNAVYKNCGVTNSATGQVAVYGAHWGTRFVSATAGFVDVLCNEPSSTSTAQCFVSGGTPQFNSNGSVLLTKVGDQVTWEMPFFAIGFTSFTNLLATVSGTNVTWTAGSAWGNHTLEFAINTGAGYGAYLALNAVNLSAQVIASTPGFALRVRATTLTVNAANVLTRLALPLTTTSVAQQTSLYPLSSNTVTFTGLPTACDVVVLAAGTTTILASVDAGAGTSFIYTYSGAQAVDVGFIKPGFVPLYIRNLALTEANSVLPVSLTPDRNYS